MQDNNIQKAFKAIFLNCEYSPERMVMKYPALVQVVRRKWLLRKLESVMSTKSTVKNYKEFLVMLSKILLTQEKHKMLKLQNNFYEKVQYYCNRRTMTAGEKNPRAEKRIFSADRITTADEDPSSSNQSRIHHFFNKQPLAKRKSTQHFASRTKLSKKDINQASKEFYWDHEIDKLHQDLVDSCNGSNYRIFTPTESMSRNNLMSARTYNTMNTNDLNQSLISKNPKPSKQIDKIKEQYEQFKNFVETNTQEELISVRNFMFGTSTNLRNTTAAAGAERPTFTSTDK